MPWADRGKTRSQFGDRIPSCGLPGLFQPNDAWPRNGRAYGSTMASTTSKLMNFATRGLSWVMFRKTLPLPDYRPRMERMDRAQQRPMPAGLQLQEVDQPVPGRWLRPDVPVSAQVLLYLHGGAFAFRLPHGHSNMVARICIEAGCAAFLPWYRLAPEHPFPAAPDDCLAAYRTLLDAGHAASDIVVMGDSAGGNLALVLLHSIKRAGLPMPRGAIALSPITDFAQISASWRLNKDHDPMYRLQGVVNPAHWYFKGHDPLDPIISPYYGDFTGFPPLYFVVGSIEALLDDSVGMVRKAVDLGIPAKVHIWTGMPHVFMLQEFLPETRQARAHVVQWLRELRLPQVPPTRPGLHRSCVEVFDLSAFTRQVTLETNDVFA
jgi:epsilon-lactone hydrolase